MEDQKIKNFTDLIAWQEAHKFALEVYELTRKFPREELYSLTDQLKRAVISVTSNIAEGFSRRNFREKVQFYYIALGSLTEAQNQLIFAKDIGFITNEDYETSLAQIIKIQKLLNALIRSIRDSQI